MIASDIATVAELNRRARADRVRNGEVTGDGVDIASGQTAGIGDQVVTRQNDRRLTSRGGWVKNGDTWTVAAIHDDRSVALRHIDRGDVVRVPAGYVSNHVDLGYAVTTYQVQGRTVDTAHSLISPTSSRESVYVSASRGRENNRLYVDTSFDPDPETGHDKRNRTNSAHQVLAEVLANEGAELPAHEVIRRPHVDSHSRHGASPVAVFITNPATTTAVAASQKF